VAASAAPSKEHRLAVFEIWNVRPERALGNQLGPGDDPIACQPNDGKDPPNNKQLSQHGLASITFI